MSKKDLPQFAGQSHEDAIAFLSRYERTGRFYRWGDKDKLEYLYLCSDRAAQSWHESVEKRFKSWPEMLKGFLDFFGKNKDDFVVEKFTARSSAADDPNS